MYSQRNPRTKGEPLFDKEARLPSWKKVTNSLAVESQEPLVLQKYDGPPIDNVSWPNGPGSASAPDNFLFKYPKQKEYFSYLARFYDAQQPNEWPVTYFLNQKPTDLILYGGDIDTWIGIASFPENVIKKSEDLVGGGIYYSPIRQFILENLNKGSKMVLFNQPDYLEFPYFHLYHSREIINTASFSRAPISDSSLLIPSDQIKEALTYRNSKVAIPEHHILSKDEIDVLRRYIQLNNENVIGLFAENYSLPLVDLHSLFKKILAKEYTTQDGLFIDPSFLDGNFFSNDGLYPSAIGCAVIANEVIIQLNRKYGTKIPAIKVRAFAASLK